MTGLNYSEGRPIPLPISQGGTGSPTQNFVDLSSTQSIGGAKTFSGTTHLHGFTLTSDAQFAGYDLANTGLIYPNANNAYNLGSTSAYWQNLYATTLNLNSTASISGSTAGAVTVAANGVFTGANANSLTVGPNGTTNPTFNVDDSTASVATGLNIKGAAAGSGLAVSVISSGTNENLTINAKGSGTITLGSVSTGSVTVSAPLVFTDYQVAYGNLVAGFNNSYLLGDYTANYWESAAISRVYLNSTAYLDGGTAGVLDITGAINTSGLTTMTQSGASTTGALVIQDNTSSAANAVVTIEDDTNYAFSGTLLTLTQFNSTDTGTPLQINNYGTSSASLNITNGTSTVFSISQAGLPTFGGTNTTGSGTALLGANSPASTNTAPYTWIEAIAADGSTVYFPAWK